MSKLAQRRYSILSFLRRISGVPRRNMLLRMGAQSGLLVYVTDRFYNPKDEGRAVYRRWTQY
jgi:hypothetical protein